MRDRLHGVLVEAVRRAIAEIDPAAVPWDGEVQLAPPKIAEHGDFATNVSLALAKRLRRDPLELAQRILACVDDRDGIIARAEVARPGFINVFLARAGFADALRRVLRERERYGRARADAGARTSIEFVSANPTGPLTIGHGRNAVLGDCVARLLDAAGARVTREFYFNDAGRQMRVLGESLRARYLQALGREAPLPEDGYHGEYLREIAEALAVRVGESFADAELASFTREAKDAVFAEIRGTLERLGIAFDVFFNEASLYADGEIERTLADLRAAGVVYESEGAVWLRASALGLERDRVLVKSSGEPTYLLPDIAYHRDKFRRGFERMLDVLGPDHLEQFPYVQVALRALGYDASALEVVHYQWVNLRRGDELVKMSKRAANFVTVDDVLDDVGPDVFRWFMVDRRADTHLDFDLELAKERSDRNPVYKVQYAHARLSSIERQAAERGVQPLADDALPLARLEQAAETELLKRLGAWPDTLARAARLREPHEITRYLLDLASEFHAYVTDGRRHRVLSEDADLTQARLALVRGIRLVLANGLGLLGVAAPERM